MNRKIILVCAAVAAVGLIVLLILKLRGGSEPSAGDGKPAGDKAKAGAKPVRASSGDDSPSSFQRPPEFAEDADPIGSLVLEGQVVDGDGEPVGGATVRLSSNPPRTATTADDGSFSFDKLIGREYALTARKGSLIGGPVERKLSATSDPVVIRVAVGAKVEVTVVGKASQKPIAGATVTLDKDDGTATTNDAGIATFDGIGQFAWLSASAAGYAPGEAWVQVPGEPGTTIKTKIQLERGAPLSGKVVGPDGSPVAGAKVVPVDTAAAFSFGSDSTAAVSADDGTFTIAAVPAGTYRVEATHKSFAPGSSDPVTADGVTATKGVTVKLTPGAVLAGIVVDASRQPVAWASISVRTRDSQMNGFGAELRSASTDEAGKFEMAGLPRGPVVALAVADGASSKAIPYDLAATPEQRNVTIILDVTGKISGIVVDTVGQPIAEAQVSAMTNWMGGDTENLDLVGSMSRSTDGDGRFEFRGLADGSYRLTASRTSTAAMWMWQNKGTIAETGASGVKLVIAADGGIEGKLAIAGGGAPTAFRVTIGWPPGVPVSNDTGEFSLSTVAPGRYDVTLTSLEFAEHIVRDVVVEEGKTTDLGTINVERGRFVEGRVTDARGGPVGGATVVVGKQLFGDGKSMTAQIGDGAEEMMGLRRATTDADGRYRIVGLDGSKQVVAAEQPELGRSLPVSLPASKEPAKVDLVLRGFGSVTGKIMVAGKPAADTQVLATSAAATEQTVMVKAGPDGVYRIDRLAEGDYTVMVVVDPQIGGGTMARKAVTVAAGKQARLDFDITVGDITLTIGYAGKDGAKIDAAQVFLFEGEVQATTGAEIQKLFMGSGGSAKSGFAWGADKPAKMEKVTPGAATICALPVNGNLMDPQFQKRIQENLETLKVYCQPHEITASPKDQTYTAVIPAMDPFPEPTP